MSEAKRRKILEFVAADSKISSTKLRLIKSAAIGAVTKYIIISNSESCH